MDYSTCQPVKQFLSKYPETNLVDIVKLCKDIVSLKNEPKTENMDNEKELLRMSVKDLKKLAKENKIKKYYKLTKEELIRVLQEIQPEPELPADGKTSFFKKQKTTTKTKTIVKEEETHVEEIKTTDTPQEQPTEGQEEKKKKK